MGSTCSSNNSVDGIGDSASSAHSASPTASAMNPIHAPPIRTSSSLVPRPPAAPGASTTSVSFHDNGDTRPSRRLASTTSSGVGANGIAIVETTRQEGQRPTGPPAAILSGCNSITLEEVGSLCTSPRFAPMAVSNTNNGMISNSPRIGSPMSLLANVSGAGVSSISFGQAFGSGGGDRGGGVGSPEAKKTFPQLFTTTFGGGGGGGEFFPNQLVPHACTSAAHANSRRESMSSRSSRRSQKSSIRTAIFTSVLAPAEAPSTLQQFEESTGVGHGTTPPLLSRLTSVATISSVHQARQHPQHQSHRTGGGLGSSMSTTCTMSEDFGEQVMEEDYESDES